MALLRLLVLSLLPHLSFHLALNLLFLRRATASTFARNSFGLTGFIVELAIVLFKRVFLFHEAFWLILGRHV